MSRDSTVDGPAPPLVLDRGVGMRWLLLLIPVALVIVTSLPAIAELVANAWNAGNERSYSQGWLIVPIAIWLLHQASAEMPRLSFRPEPRLIVAAFLVSVLVLLAARTNVVLLELVLLPVLMVAGIGALFGWRSLRLCLLGVGFLYFAIPIWDIAGTPLQWGTVMANRFLVRVFGIPASFDATSIHLPSGTIVVEGGCSGIHYFIVGLTLGTLYAHVANKPVRRTLLLAAGLSILANWIRVFVILVAGYLTNMQHYLVRVDHYKFGWLVFAGTLVVFFWLAARLPARAPARARVVEEPSRSTTNWLAVSAALAAIVAGPLASLALDARGPATASRSVVPPAGWTQVSAALSEWRPSFRRADRTSRSSWQKGSHLVESFQAEYGDQTPGKKLAGFGNTLLGDEVPVISTAGTDVHEWQEMIVAGGEQTKALLWYSYYVGDRDYASALRAQIEYGLRGILRAEPSGVVALRTTCATDCAAERESLRSFAAALPGT